MSSSEDTPGLIGLTRIAQLSGVRPSAVSNWRRRYKDFPEPKAGSGRQILFDLNEVEAWLLENEKLQERIGEADRLDAVLENCRTEGPVGWSTDFARAGLAYLVACRANPLDGPGSDALVKPQYRWERVAQSAQPLTALAVATEKTEAELESLRGLFVPLQDRSNHSPALDQLKISILDTIDALLGDKAPPIEVLDGIAEFELRVEGRRLGEHTTPDSLIDLVCAVVPGRAKTVWDPAAGGGRMLSSVVETVGAHEVFASEINAVNGRALRTRFFLEGRQVALEIEDSLTAPEWPKVDLVTANPPLGTRKWGRPEDYGDPRWKFGAVPPSNAELAWVQLASLSLESQGSGVVVTSQGPLFQTRAGSKIRKKMVDSGVIEAIITLPPGLLFSTMIPSALWVLRSIKSPVVGGPILLLDFSEAALESRNRLPASTIDLISRTLTAWRTGDVLSDDSKAHSVVIEPSDLQDDYVLLPSRFLGPPELDRDRLSEEVQDSIGLLKRHPIPRIDEDLLSVSSVTDVVNSELGEVVEIIRGRTRLEPEDDLGVEFSGRSNFEREDFVGRHDGHSNAPYLFSYTGRRWHSQPLPRDSWTEGEVRVRSGDVALAFSSRGPESMFLWDMQDGSIPAAGVWLLRSRDRDRLLPAWLQSFLSSQSFSTQVARAARPGIAPLGMRITAEALNTILIPIPPLYEQTRFVEQYRKLHSYELDLSRAARCVEEVRSAIFDLAVHEREEGDR